MEFMIIESSVHRAPDRQPHQHPTTLFFTALPATQPTVMILFRASTHLNPTLSVSLFNFTVPSNDFLVACYSAECPP